MKPENDPVRMMLVDVIRANPGLTQREIRKHLPIELRSDRLSHDLDALCSKQKLQRIVGKTHERVYFLYDCVVSEASEGEFTEVHQVCRAARPEDFNYPLYQSALAWSMVHLLGAS